MKQVIEATGKTVEAAIANGADELGVDRDLVTYEIIEMPKKGFLGFGEIPARVRVTYNTGTENTALNFVKTLISDIGIDATAEICDIPGTGRNKLIKISGEESGILIGHHGATLDALQYLVNLAANRKEEESFSDDKEPSGEEESENEEDNEAVSGLKDQITERAKNYAHSSVRITVDIENYREKREKTLRDLAKKMAAKALKYNKSITLEPMNPYERRIIHSEIQEIEGVMTTSVGADSDRRIVIYLEEGYQKRKSGRSRNSHRRSGNKRPSENVVQERASIDNADDTVADTVAVDSAEE